MTVSQHHMHVSYPLTVVQTPTGIMWEIKVPGEVIRAFSGRDLMSRHREWLQRQGLPVPPAV